MAQSHQDRHRRFQEVQTPCLIKQLPVSHPFCSPRHFALDETSLSATPELLPQQDALTDPQASLMPSTPLPPKVLIHHLADLQGHRRGLLLVWSRLFHLPSSLVIVSHYALLPRRIFHMPYLILCQLMLHRHDIPACSNSPHRAVVHCSLKWKERYWNASTPHVLLGTHLQMWTSAEEDLFHRASEVGIFK